MYSQTYQRSYTQQCDLEWLLSVAEDTFLQAFLQGLSLLFPNTSCMVGCLLCISFILRSVPHNMHIVTYHMLLLYTCSVVSGASAWLQHTHLYVCTLLCNWLCHILAKNIYMTSIVKGVNRITLEYVNAFTPSVDPFRYTVIAHCPRGMCWCLYTPSYLHNVM